MDKKILNIVALFVVVGIFSGCEKVFTTYGNGRLISMEKTFSSFEKVNVRGDVEVRFYESEEYLAVITVDENLCGYVDVFTKNNTLNIGKEGILGCSFTKFLVEVYCPTLTGVKISGSGNFSGIDEITASSFEAGISGSGKMQGFVDCTNFSAKISGSGKMTMSGNAVNSNVEISGSGKFIGNELITANTTAGISGSGQANVHVSDYLEAKISGSGAVNYWGNPKTVNTKISGSGRVKKM